MAKKEPTERVNLSLSKEQKGYLEALVKVGIHGKNPSEVAKTMVIREIERLITDGFIKLKTSSDK